MWFLSPDVHHLNHGSFGAVPVPVQEERARWLARWEQEPTRFIFSGEVQTALDGAREVVARFVGASPDGFAFVRNTTSGVAAVVRSLEPFLREGDEMVTTNHAYNAVRQTMEFSASRTGARVRVADVPLPIDDPVRVTAAVVEAVTDRTRLVVIDHISSPTGLVFPVEDIVGRLEPDVPVLIDGAHAPGQVPLDLDGIGASWYTGNLHKWVCAPRGAGFLVTRSDRLSDTYPAVISHAWQMEAGPQRYRALFDWLGTDDMSPWLAAPEAIRVVGAIRPGGWPEVMRTNHELAIAARDLLCEVLGVDPIAPDWMTGSMAAIRLPDLEADPALGLSPLTAQLMAAGFEAVVGFWPEPPNQLLRISAHQYNTIEEYEALSHVLIGPE